MSGTSKTERAEQSERRDSEGLDSEDADRTDSEQADRSARADADGSQDSSEGENPDSPEGEDGEDVSRRAFIRKTGATAATAAGATAVATEDASAQEVTTYRFGGKVAGWVGVEPPDIADNTNPTIELQAGQEYEMIWKNLDGAPHNLKIQNAEGQTLAGTELVREEGATASFTFTAKPAMAQYICTIHPTTMVGDINVTGELEGGGGGGNRLPASVLSLAAGVALAFISPLLFALFLFSRRGESGESETPTG